jgi:hypothetical protein
MMGMSAFILAPIATGFRWLILVSVALTTSGCAVLSTEALAQT